MSRDAELDRNDLERVSFPVSRSQLGAALAIFTVALLQFIDLELFSLGKLVISFQKLAALSLFPVSLILMGRVRIGPAFVVLAVLMIMVNSAASWTQGSFLDERLLSANATVVMGLASAVILYTALTIHSDGILFLARSWVLIGCITAVLTCLQAVRLVPLFFVPEGYLYMRETMAGGLLRGTGLKYDPNFQAMVLAVGVAFSQCFAPKYRYPATIVLIAGIFFTFSRMALVAALLSVMTAPLMSGAYKRHERCLYPVRFLLAFTVAALVTGLFAAAGPSDLRDYMVERIAQAVTAVRNIASYSTVEDLVHPSSTETRILLAKGAWNAFLEHPLYGVGAYVSPEVLKEKVGVGQVAHNTFLEFLMTGGVFGIGAITVYSLGLMRGLRFLRRTRRCCSTENVFSGEIAAVYGQSFIFGLFFLSLTLNYNFILWFPLVLVLACRRRVADALSSR